MLPGLRILRERLEHVKSIHIYYPCEHGLDWNPATKEMALDPSSNMLVVYGAAKTIAEQEVWKYAEAHPEIDVTSSG